MLKRKTKTETEEEKPSYKELLEKEYDSFAAPPTMGSPDNGLSVYVKLHQILEYLGILIKEMQALRQDVNNQEEPAPVVQEESKEIY